MYTYTYTHVIQIYIYAHTYTNVCTHINIHTYKPTDKLFQQCGYLGERVVLRGY